MCKVLSLVFFNPSQHVPPLHCLSFPFPVPSIQAAGSSLFPLLYMDHLLPQYLQLSLHLPDPSPPATSSAFKLQLKKVFCLCFYLPRSPHLTSQVFTEHRAPTGRRRMNSAYSIKQGNLTFDFLINLLSQNNNTIVKSLKTNQIINCKTMQQVNCTFDCV